MTAAESREIVRMILSGWPTQRQRMSAADVQGMALFYAAGLEDLDADAARAAIRRIGRTSEWMPTIAAIRAAIGVNEHGVRRAGAEAWGEVLQAMRARGSHKEPGVDFAFADPITARVVRALGWSELCRSDNAIADRARFVDAYDQIAKSERVEAQAAPGATIARELPAAITPPERQLEQSISDEDRAEIAEMIRRIAEGP